MKQSITSILSVSGIAPNRRPAAAESKASNASNNAASNEYRTPELRLWSSALPFLGRHPKEGRSPNRPANG